MAHLQMLLVVLVMILVGIALAVGINMYASSSKDANRTAVISDLFRHASKAQRYFRTSREFGGGAQNFDNFALSPSDTGNLNGSFSLSTTLPAGSAYIKGSVTKVTGTSGKIYIIGCGREIGDDKANGVKAFVSVSRDSVVTDVLN